MTMTKHPAIYLDYQATTPLDRRALAAMQPFLEAEYGNPHSIQHDFGARAEAAVEKARGQVADLIGADPREIIFTSGATEANNLAIIGAARFRARLGDGVKRVVTFAAEHKCVLEAVASLKDEGFETEVLPVTPDGFADLDALEAALETPTTLVALMAVNNEVGVIQPIEAAAKLTRAKGALLHVDAAQAVGKIPLNATALGIDLLSMSAHKTYGPKGIGALFVRRRPRARLLPLIHGGGQERGLRSGTLPAPLCVGFGAAAAIAGDELAAEAERLLTVRQAFLDALDEADVGYEINGDMVRRVPGNLNLAIDGVEALALMQAAPDVAVATGSACSSASVEPSYVLRSMEIAEERARRSLRIGFGRFTTVEDAREAARRLARAARALHAQAAAE